VRWLPCLARSAAINCQSAWTSSAPFPLGPTSEAALPVAAATGKSVRSRIGGDPPALGEKRNGIIVKSRSRRRSLRDNESKGAPGLLHKIQDGWQSIQIIGCGTGRQKDQVAEPHDRPQEGMNARGKSTLLLRWCPRMPACKVPVYRRNTRLGP
jgi:hypothetical protein